MAKDICGRPEWESDFVWHSLSGDRFSRSDNSVWGPWLEHIEAAEIAQNERIEQWEKKWRKDLSPQEQEYNDYGGDVLSDMKYQASEVSNAMHAAVIVSMWAGMETELNQLIGICNRALNTNGEAYPFKKAKAFFYESLSIDISQVSEYYIIQAVHILNNSFKHDNGRYEPDQNRPHTQIDPSLTTQFKITANNPIDYSALPLRDLLDSSNCFVKELIEKIKEYLRDNTGSSSSE